MNFDFSTFLSSKGIHRRISCPHTPQQNGMVERKHQHLIQTGRCLLNHSGIPHHHWLDAFHRAVFIVNQFPTPVLKNKSPFQMLFDRIPDYSILRTYGCLYFLPLIPKAMRSKLDTTSPPSCFIDYVREYKGYKCLDLIFGKIVISKHVLFDESTLSFHRRKIAEGNLHIS